MIVFLVYQQSIVGKDNLNQVWFELCKEYNHI